MNRTNRTHLSWKVAIVAAIGAVALAAPPAAQADPPGDWPRRAALVEQAASVRPDDRPGPRGVVEAASSVRPDDRADRRIAIGSEEDALTPSVTDTGFDWGNAFGLTLFLAAIGLSIAAMRYTHTRHRTS